MRRPRGRFTVRGMTRAVAACAVVLSAFSDRTGLAASAYYTLVVLGLLTATVALHARPAPGLRGFVVFGWGYLALCIRSTPMPPLLWDYLALEWFLASARPDPLRGFWIGPEEQVMRSPFRRESYQLSPGHVYASIALTLGAGVALAGAWVGRLVAPAEGAGGESEGPGFVARPDPAAERTPHCRGERNE